MQTRWLLIALASALFPLRAWASPADLLPQPYDPPPIPPAAIWVSPTGSDLTGNGTQARPFFTPARAAESGSPIILAPGRYPQFGTITHGGTGRDPLVIRSASGTAVFAQQDANVPATIKASHVRLEGVEIHGLELADPGTCLAIRSDVEDVTIAHSRIHHCGDGIVVENGSLANGTLEDVTLSDIEGTALSCTGTCTHQRWTNVLIEHIGSDSASGTATLVANGAQDIRIRDLTVRDVQGDGARFLGARPSIVNGQFRQISGTALQMDHGGYVGRTDVEAEGYGLKGGVGTGLTIERSLFVARQPSAIPFAITQSTSSTQDARLTLTWSRFDVPNGTLQLAAKGDTHQTVWNEGTFWFRDDTDKVILGDQQVVIARNIVTSSVERTGDSQLYFDPPYENDLFSSTFSGGVTTVNEGGGKTITAGSLIRGNEQEHPYVLGEEQRVHLLEDTERKTRWYPHGENITTIGDGPFSSLLRSDDVTEPPGTLIKSSARPQVYLVTAPNLLRWISSEALAKAYAGPHWNQQIIEMKDGAITHYREVEPILTEEDLEDDDVLRRYVDPADLFDELASK